MRVWAEGKNATEPRIFPLQAIDNASLVERAALEGGGTDEIFETALRMVRHADPRLTNARSAIESLPDEARLAEAAADRFVGVVERDAALPSRSPTSRWPAARRRAR